MQPCGLCGARGGAAGGRGPGGDGGRGESAGVSDERRRRLRAGLHRAAGGAGGGPAGLRPDGDRRGCGGRDLAGAGGPKATDGGEGVRAQDRRDGLNFRQDILKKEAVHDGDPCHGGAG